MKFSIITVNYNNLEGLKKTAQTVLAQTYHGYEWIVIDGGSKDGAKEYLSALSSQLSTKDFNPLTYWCSEPDKGIYNGMNKGILHAKGEYCLFLNSGDYFCSKKSLQRLSKYNMNADIVECDIFNQRNFIFDAYHEAPRVLTFRKLFFTNICHQSTFVKTSLLKANGYCEDYRICSDWKYWIETIMINHGTYQHIPIPVTVYEDCGISTTQEKKVHQEQRKIMEEYINPYLRQFICKTGKNEYIFESGTVLNSEIVVLNIMKKTIDFVFYYCIFPLVTIYKNMKYRSIHY